MHRAVLITLALLLALSATAHAYDWQPFVNFLPVYGDAFAPSWRDQCAEQVAAPHNQSAWCEGILDCVLEHSSESLKANIAGASILLGLAPTILGTLAPAIEDLAFLSSQRPLLALLLAAGTPALSAANPLGDPNPVAPALKRLDSARGVFAGGARRRTDAAAIAINVAEYLVAAACAANVVSLSYDLMQRTVVTWSCPNWGWVVGWSSVPAGLYVLAALLFRATVRTGRRQNPRSGARRGPPAAGPGGAAPAPIPLVATPASRYGAHPQPNDAKDDMQYRLVQNPPGAGDDFEADFDTQPHQQRGGGVLGFLWRHEFQPCAQRRLPAFRVSRTWYAQLLRWVIPLGCFVQYVMGTAILASLFPVIVRDAFPVLVRYSVSGAVAHVVASFELRGLGEQNGGEGGVEWRWVGEREERGGEM